MKGSIFLIVILALAGNCFAQTADKNFNMEEQISTWKYKRNTLRTTSLIMAGTGGLLILTGLTSGNNTDKGTGGGVGGLDLEIFGSGEVVAIVGTVLSIASIPLAVRSLYYQRKIKKANLSLSVTSTQTIKPAGVITNNLQPAFVLSFTLGKRTGAQYTHIGKTGF